MPPIQPDVRATATPLRQPSPGRAAFVRPARGRSQSTYQMVSSSQALVHGFVLTGMSAQLRLSSLTDRLTGPKLFTGYRPNLQGSFAMIP